MHSLSYCCCILKAKLTRELIILDSIWNPLIEGFKLYLLAADNYQETMMVGKNVIISFAMLIKALMESLKEFKNAIRTPIRFLLFPTIKPN